MTPPKIDMEKICPELAEILEDLKNPDLMPVTTRMIYYDSKTGDWRFVTLTDDFHAIEKTMLKLAEACEYALSYLPAKDGKRTGEPDGDVQLMICNKLKDALGLAARKGDAHER